MITAGGVRRLALVEPEAYEADHHGFPSYRVRGKIMAGDPASEIELGDGGGTTWTGQLMGNAKERCFVSCIATERLAALSG